MATPKHRAPHRRTGPDAALAPQTSADRRFVATMVVSSSAIGGVVLALSTTRAGVNAGLVVGRFLNFYMGAFALVCLTGTVVAGLLATDRVVLLVPQRVFAQTAHRIGASAALCFLVIHILSKVVGGHARMIDTAVPFLAVHRTWYMGLGTVAGYAMLLAVVTGVLRHWFAIGSRPWVWRAVHQTAYAGWVVAIVHGLYAGRHPATWVSASYWTCVALVAVAVSVRVLAGREYRSILARTVMIARTPYSAPMPRLRRVSR
jgi:predicted ferric reductase